MKTNQIPLEMIAYNSLTDEQKQLIPASPKDSEVKIVEVAKLMVEELPYYENDKVYSVEFFHTSDAYNDNLIVYVSLDQNQILGNNR